MSFFNNNKNYLDVCVLDSSLSTIGFNSLVFASTKVYKSFQLLRQDEGAVPAAPHLRRVPPSQEVARAPRVDSEVSRGVFQAGRRGSGAGAAVLTAM